MSALTHILSGARAARLGVATQRHDAASILSEVERRMGTGFLADLQPIRSNDPLKLAALNLTDFTRNQTAFESILEVADAGTLRDGAASQPVATALFNLAGAAAAVSKSNCYGRTLHAIFTSFHAGEFNQLMADLLVRGETVLASGQRVRWDPSQLPIHGYPHHDVLWGALANNLRFADIPNPLVLSPNAGYATRAQMANLSTRLTGTQFVNAPGQALISHLNGIVDNAGPVLAEYPAAHHGGSVLRIDNGQVHSLEGKGWVQTLDSSSLGYVVVPEESLKGTGVDPIEYPQWSDGTQYFRLGS